VWLSAEVFPGTRCPQQSRVRFGTMCFGGLDGLPQCNWRWDRPFPHGLQPDEAALSIGPASRATDHCIVIGPIDAAGRLQAGCGSDAGVGGDGHRPTRRLGRSGDASASVESRSANRSQSWSRPPRRVPRRLSATPPDLQSVQHHTEGRIPKGVRPSVVLVPAPSTAVLRISRTLPWLGAVCLALSHRRSEARFGEVAEHIATSVGELRLGDEGTRGPLVRERGQHHEFDHAGVDIHDAPLAAVANTVGHQRPAWFSCRPLAMRDSLPPDRVSRETRSWMTGLPPSR
jgi:hypothetical protein